MTRDARSCRTDLSDHPRPTLQTPYGTSYNALY